MGSASDRPTAFGKSPPRVLVIEDDASVRATIARALERDGCIALSAGSAASARQLCASRPPLDLIVADLRLPDARGDELLRELAVLYGDATPKLVLMTAHMLEGPLAVHTDAVLEKPFTMKSLLQTLHVVLPDRRQRVG